MAQVCCHVSGHCSVLGQGLLPMLSTAAAANLLSPEALWLPSKVNVMGQLLDTHMHTTAAGFDVRDINKYKWHPTVEKISHNRWASSRWNQQCS